MLKKWQRLPLQEELNKLIEREVREQVLHPKAPASGLDKDDPAVRQWTKQQRRDMDNALY